MRIFEYVHLKNHVLFGDQRFDLEKQGITALFGLNRNGNKSSKISNTNACGKSLLVSSIQDLFFPQGSTGMAKDKVKQGTIESAVRIGKDRFVVTRYLKGKSEKFTIEKNGKDVTPVRSADQLSMVSSLIGKDQMAFSVIDYLDNNRPNPLRTGDTAIRKKFFTSFFDLQSTDLIRKLVKAEKDELKSNAKVLQELRAQLSATPEPTGLDIIEAELQALQKKLDTTTASLEDLKTSREYARFVEANEVKLKALVELSKRYGPTKKEILSGMKDDIRIETEILEAHRELQAYTNERKQWLAKKAEREKYLEETGLKGFDYKAERAKVKEDLAAKSGIEEARRQAEKTHSKLELTKEALLDDIASEKGDLKRLKKAGDCSKCGQPVTNEHYASERKAILKRISTLETRLQETTEALEASQVALDEMQTPAKLEKRIAAYQAKVDLLFRAPPAAEKPERPEPPEAEIPEGFNAKASEKLISRLEIGLDDVRRLFIQEHTALYLKGEKVEYNDHTYDKLVARCVHLASKVSVKEADLETAKQALESRSTLKRKIRKLKQQLEDLEVLEVLDRAFSSNSGVKQLMIRTLCRVLEAQVNKYAKFLFPEDYVFEFDLDTQFTITATRRFRNKELVSDVRKLSGSEAGLFDLALALALMTFQPPSSRLNFMILDEINANFSPAMTESFINFLPVLNKVIPHLIVVTPQSNHNYGDVNYMTVVKTGSKSKVVEGRISK